MLNSLYKKDHKLILFTAQELNPYELWKVFPKFGDYIHNLGDLSMATIQKHLDPENILDTRYVD